ncbi:MAG TPA: tetratricopeptide repeat protein, partial [Candidatus Hypogeohydataceae bacterium YC40]
MKGKALNLALYLIGTGERVNMNRIPIVLLLVGATLVVNPPSFGWAVAPQDGSASGGQDLPLRGTETQEQSTTHQEDFQRGIVLLQQGKVDEALPLLQKAVENEPTKPECYQALAHAYSKKRMWKEAVETYQKYLGLNPTDAQAHNNLGVLYNIGDMPNEAIDSYKKAIEINPK